MSARRAPLFYGWIVVAVAFVTMGVAVSARTGFSLLFPEIVTEFGWDAGVTAGAFSLGFVASTAFVPIVGWMMGRWGPRWTMPLGALLVAAGYVTVIWATTPLQLYLSFGLLAVAGSMAMSYISHSMFLPNWFVRNRGLAVGVAFAGVGALGAVMLPVMQWVMDTWDWRTACLVMAAVVVVAIVPLNFIFQRNRPEDMGLLPDGDRHPEPGDAPRRIVDTIVDRKWAETEWTLKLALRTGPFWWVSISFFCALFVWYAMQIHQTAHLLEAGFDTATAALALGMVAFGGIVGQIGIGWLSDRWGREPAWTLGLVGYIVACVLLIRLGEAPSTFLLWAMVAAQGVLGTGIAAIYGAIPAELFAGRRFPAIFAAMSLFGNMGGAAGAFALGAIHDATGSYELGFQLCLVLTVVSAVTLWIGGPRRVRLVAGAAQRRAAAGA